MQSYEGHDENTAPKTVDGKPLVAAPGTYVPLADNASSVNDKKSGGEKGK